jgi:hypothetical protein
MSQLSKPLIHSCKTFSKYSASDTSPHEITAFERFKNKQAYFQNYCQKFKFEERTATNIDKSELRKEVLG